MPCLCVQKGACFYTCAPRPLPLVSGPMSQTHHAGMCIKDSRTRRMQLGPLAAALASTAESVLTLKTWFCPGLVSWRLVPRAAVGHATRRLGSRRSRSSRLRPTLADVARALCASRCALSVVALCACLLVTRACSSAVSTQFASCRECAVATVMRGVAAGSVIRTSDWLHPALPIPCVLSLSRGCLV